VRRYSSGSGGPPPGRNEALRQATVLARRSPAAPPEELVVALPDDTDMTPDEFRAAAGQGAPVRIVTSREQCEEGR